MDNGTLVDSVTLVDNEAWEQYINSLRKHCTSFNGSKEKLQQAIVAAVKKRIPQKKCGIFFSGGVDSTVIAYLCKQFTKDLTNNFMCYTVGVKGSDDLRVAQHVAEQLHLPLRIKELSLQEFEYVVKKVAQLLLNPHNEYPLPDNENLVVAMGVASVVYAAVMLAQEDTQNTVTTFFSGLGSEEIFAGYQRHADAHDRDDVNEECWNGLKKMWRRDMIRDYTLAKALGITVLTPFLDPEVIVEAMKIKPELKINAEHKKIILREIALALGLPREIAYRPKKAAQYGSRFNHALEILAKKNNFKYKLPYVRSLV